jgi:hypothetical protein
VSFDAVMSMAIHLTDATELGELVPFEPRPPALDERWPIEDARLFLRQARDFVEVSDFHGFLEKHGELYAIAESRFRELIASEGLLDWFDRFYGARPGASFTVCLGMLNGGACYGPRVERADGEEELYCVLGVWATDENGTACRASEPTCSAPSFTSSATRTSIRWSTPTRTRSSPPARRSSPTSSGRCATRLTATGRR